MKDTKNFIVGGVSGIIARSIIAPIDKIKILMQISEKKKFSSQLTYDIKTNGVYNLWKGNLINSIRIFPYSGLQFYVYNKCKLYNISNNIFLEKMIFGSFAGICAVTATHPLDIIRHRLMYNQKKIISDIIISIYKENGLKTFYKGYGASLLGLTPYIAINFSTYDIFKNKFKETNNSYTKYISAASLSAIVSQTICYPLDTIRRNIYSENSNGFLNVTKKIFIEKGICGFYKGILPNAIKIVPQNVIRFIIFEKLLFLSNR